MSVVSKAENLIPMFNKFTHFVSENGRNISPKQFSQEFGKIQKDFLTAKQRELFCQTIAVASARQ